MTPWILPLAIIDIFLLKRMGQGRAAITLSAIPIYYLFFQSMLHTEWRFILPINYFLYLLAAVAGYWMSIAVWQNIRLLKNKQ